MRESDRKGDAFHDLVMMALLRKEWPPAQGLHRRGASIATQKALSRRSATTTRRGVVKKPRSGPPTKSSVRAAFPAAAAPPGRQCRPDREQVVHRAGKALASWSNTDNFYAFSSVWLANCRLLKSGRRTAFPAGAIIGLAAHSRYLAL